MTDKDRLEEQRRSLALALRRAELTVEELWLRQFSLGGDSGLIEIDAYLHGIGELDPLQRDVLAQTVNERLDEVTWAHRASYSRPVRDSRPLGRPHAALVGLLEGAELAPPDRLPAVAEAACRLIGVEVTIYLADYDQRLLHRVNGASTSNGDRRQETLQIDTTLAGRAFREVRALPSTTAGRPLLWVPLLDGAERLGVLEVRPADPADLEDPGLRTQCRWLSMLLGHLVTLLDQYGDAFDLVRLPKPRTTGGELIWSLLPPLTAGVDNFVVTGVVEPRQEVNGDAFDYALSEHTATLVIIDAAGHDVRSGLVTATALAAHRRARHAGHGLYEQARAMDEAIGELFDGRSSDGRLSATAVLAELDLAGGRLRYLNAGHPPPLVMRAGKVVKPLTGGLRPPLGLGAHALTIAEEALQPDDWLVLHTDGITEARDRTGVPFGDARLADCLQREAAAGYPPPETARRLIRAILEHQDGELQDDATVLLARWSSPRHPT
ncbi:hypothetical protein FHS29_005223 [Saccharothrix tamanrassetensis]|uniref:PPM-type phosphatase domain-containing protein n=1 Tax=Saccharothrix tamanrassetensis TaxID=1051531 RepID=A0A841CRL7_9PSEU|nr:PP2C family protein-serine/threonine phosphatase [Saccharothrix tamanrassetensis]MBB5958615.1 hypothetical protein [Saccharothrix tamanrassetensis]